MPKALSTPATCLNCAHGRYYFAGREDGTINVGGLKVHPEEVEAVINRHPQVSMSLVRTKKSPITGAIVIADVVLKTPQSAPDGTTTHRSATSCSFAAESLRSTRFQPQSILCRRWPWPKPESWFAAMRNVIVTGGSRGLGLGIARRLAAVRVSRDRDRAKRKRRVGRGEAGSREAQSGLACISCPSILQRSTAFRIW